MTPYKRIYERLSACMTPNKVLNVVGADGMQLTVSGLNTGKLQQSYLKQISVRGRPLFPTFRLRTG
jgi:hypothetical protein